jgi:hypothetical protein
MDTKIKMTYNFNPLSLKLDFLVDGKLKGCLIGNIAVRKFFELLESGADINIGGTLPMNESIKVRKLRALWIKQGVDEFRDSILKPYGVTSTAALNDQQLDELISRFTSENKSSTPTDIRNKRSVILKLLMELGIYDNSGDWTRVNAYLMDNRIAGKLLYQMTLEELQMLTSKLRSIVSKADHERKAIKRLQILN